MGRTRTTEEIKEFVNNLGYVLLDEYMNVKRRAVIQDEWGYKYDVYLDILVRGQIPNFVDKGNPNSLENISLWLFLEETPFCLCDGNEYKGNKEKLWFHCLLPECNEDFDMSWNAVYSKKQGCPYCSGHRVSDRNRLSIVSPQIANEWDYELNKDSPHDVSYASNRSKFWKCPKGHDSYPAQIDSRTHMGSGCPRCFGNIVTDENNLSIVRPDIAREWDHDLNEDSPENVAYSSNKRRWWKCPKGHKSYPATMNNRTNGGNGCPRCADEQKESKVATGLKQWCYHNFKEKFHEEYNIIRNPETGTWLWYDIYLGEEETIDGVYIEVHGPQHYKLSGFNCLQAIKKGTTPEEEFKYCKKLDKIKKKYAQENGFYIEVDLRKINTTEQAIEYVENIISKL